MEVDMAQKIHVETCVSPNFRASYWKFLAFHFRISEHFRSTKNAKLPFFPVFPNFFQPCLHKKGDQDGCEKSLHGSWDLFRDTERKDTAIIKRPRWDVLNLFDTQKPPKFPRFLAVPFTCSSLPFSQVPHLFWIYCREWLIRLRNLCESWSSIKSA